MTSKEKRKEYNKNYYLRKKEKVKEETKEDIPTALSVEDINDDETKYIYSEEEVQKLLKQQEIFFLNQKKAKDTTPQPQQNHQLRDGLILATLPIITPLLIRLVGQTYLKHTQIKSQQQPETGPQQQSETQSMTQSNQRLSLDMLY